MMPTLIRFAFRACFVIVFVGEARAKEFIVRCDVVELEYAVGDERGFAEPTNITVRHIEAPVDEVGEFRRNDVDQGWNLSVSGKTAGTKDGRLRVPTLRLSYGPAGTSPRWQEVGGTENFVSEKPVSCGGACSRPASGPARETFLICSGFERPKTDRDAEERCAEIRKAVLARVAEIRKMRKVEFDDKEKAASRVLVLAKQLLDDTKDEGAGRVLLETVIQQFGETEACREAKEVWNRLPNVTYRYSVDPPKHVAKGVRVNGAPNRVE